MQFFLKKILSEVFEGIFEGMQASLVKFLFIEPFFNKMLTDPSLFREILTNKLLREILTDANFFREILTILCLLI